MGKGWPKIGNSTLSTWYTTITTLADWVRFVLLPLHQLKLWWAIHPPRYYAWTWVVVICSSRWYSQNLLLGSIPDRLQSRKRPTNVKRALHAVGCRVAVNHCLLRIGKRHKPGYIKQGDIQTCIRHRHIRCTFLSWSQSHREEKYLRKKFFFW